MCSKGAEERLLTSVACAENLLPAEKLSAAFGRRPGNGEHNATLTSSDASVALDALTGRLSLEESNRSRPGGLLGIAERPEAAFPESRQAASHHIQEKSSAAAYQALFARSGTASGRDHVGKGPEADGDAEGDGEGDEEAEGDEKYVRMREKNRRAQQRFRQRQKAKLQAKELESFQLQKQIQDLQAQLASMQLQGTPADMRLRMTHMQAQNQALQLENAELRLLATRLMDENASLQASRGAQLQSGQQAAACSKSGISQSGQVSSSSNRPSHQASVYLQDMPEELLLGSLSRVLMPQRSRVFSNIRGVPWQRASRFLEAGLPVGVSPGGTGMSVLVKVLSKTENGSSTVLAQFPPGFVHDYILGTETHMEEGLILSGSLTDTAFNKTFYPGDYAYVMPGTRHGPYRADEVEGALVLTFTRGRG